MEDQELTKGAGLVHAFGIGGCDVGVKWVKIIIDRLTKAGFPDPAINGPPFRRMTIQRVVSRIFCRKRWQNDRIRVKMGLCRSYAQLIRRTMILALIGEALIYLALFRERVE